MAPTDGPSAVVDLVHARRTPRRDASPELRPRANVPVDVEWRASGWPCDWRERRRVRTDRDGRFRVCGPPSDAEVVLRARPGAGCAVSRSGTLAAGTVFPLALVLSRDVPAEPGPQQPGGATPP